MDGESHAPDSNGDAADGWCFDGMLPREEGVQREGPWAPESHHSADERSREASEALWPRSEANTCNKLEYNNSPVTGDHNHETTFCTVYTCMDNCPTVLTFIKKAQDMLLTLYNTVQC